MHWTQYHHASLVNATLACYLRNKDSISDITAKYLLHISLVYHNDPSIPSERKFEVRGTHFCSRDDPTGGSLYHMVFASRAPAVQMGKVEMGNNYWGTGAYLLMVKFRPGRNLPGVDGIPYWKHFGIDKLHANAKPACRNPLEQFKENVEAGTKMRFCCGRIEGAPTCCCGGWTHEVSGHAPQKAW